MKSSIDRKTMAKFMQDGWKMFCAYTEKPQMNDNDWEKLINESRDIWERSGRDVLVGDVVNAYLQEIERRFKEDGDN